MSMPKIEPYAKDERVQCPLGGFAPCVDDLCHGGTTMCGLEPGYDFCQHDAYPDTCSVCNADDDWDDYPEGREGAEA